MSSSQLPPEILEDVFLPLSGNINALRACALVCSLWTSVAQPILFSEFIITRGLAWSKAQKVPAYFLQRIAPLVRVLVVKTSHDAVQAAFCDVACAFPGVHTLHFFGGLRKRQQGNIPLVRWASFGHIRALTLLGTFDSSTAVFRAVAAFPMLQDLNMDVTLGQFPTWRIFGDCVPPAPRLRTAKCIGRGLGLPMALWLASAQPCALQTLSLILSPETLDYVYLKNLLLVSRRSLKELCVCLDPDQDFTPGCEFSYWLFPSMTEMTLTSLTLVLPYAALHDIVNAVVLSHLRSLKLIFSFLSTPHDHNDCDDVLAVMTLPSLERLEVIVAVDVNADLDSDRLLRPFCIASERGILLADVLQTRDTDHFRLHYVGCFHCSFRT